MLGNKTPDFELLNQEGKSVRLSDYAGRKVILFAFPQADTMGCNMQACSFRDEFPEIRTANALVLGISPDSPETLRQWKTDKKLPYDLLSDPDHVVLEAWGAWRAPLFGPIRVPGVNRSVWVIDEQGVVIAEKINASPKGSVKFALEAVGEVAPLG